MTVMTASTLPPEIEVYQVGGRRLYVKTSGQAFALFEDELTPEQLVAIADDISSRQQKAEPSAQATNQGSAAPLHGAGKVINLADAVNKSWQTGT
jgi:hypothetical protein